MIYVLAILIGVVAGLRAITPIAALEIARRAELYLERGLGGLGRGRCEQGDGEEGSEGGPGHGKLRC